MFYENEIFNEIYSNNVTDKRRNDHIIEVQIFVLQYVLKNIDGNLIGNKYIQCN